MPIITTGTAFTSGSSVTSAKLNNIANAATFNDPVDGTSLELKGDGKLGIRDNGVTAAKILNSSVTFDKLNDVQDDPAMASAASNKLATSGSIKTYIDSTAITQSTGDAPYYGCRAWAHYDMITQNIRASGNIDSITRNSTGKCTVVFTEPMPSAYYAISLGDTGTVIPSVSYTLGIIDGTPTANGFSLAFVYPLDGAQLADQAIVSFSVFA
tara:strand:+ start:1101 stop:1736 length:636 start_codon:yes stop_codon:yes gene_type:complete